MRSNALPQHVGHCRLGDAGLRIRHLYAGPVIVDIGLPDLGARVQRQGLRRHHDPIFVAFVLVDVVRLVPEIHMARGSRSAEAYAGRRSCRIAAVVDHAALARRALDHVACAETVRACCAAGPTQLRALSTTAHLKQCVTFSLHCEQAAVNIQREAKMLDISSARVMRCVVHRVGNRLREEGCELSQQEVHGTAELHGTLLRHYLAPLAKAGEAFELYHESDIELNAVRQFSSRIFSESDDFIILTQNIAKQLYASSVHSSIAAGEFITILFCDVRIDDEPHFALGLYKIEQRETFLDVERTDDSLNLVELSGIPISSIQKGALIIGSSFDIFVKESSGQQTKYWAESFLKARPKQTEKSTAKLAAQFVKQVCSRIDVEAGMSLRRDLVDVFSANETLSFRDVEEVSERYLDRDEVSRLTHQLADQSGFASLATSAIDSATLTRQARNFLRQYPLGEGIGITISNPKARLDKCTISKTMHGYQAIIDINVEVGG